MEWVGKEAFYDRLVASGELQEKDIRPEIGLFNDWISAFFELSTTRSFANGAGPIPITSVWVYSDRLGYDDIFIHMMKALDNEFLRVVNKDGNKHGKKGSKPHA